MSEARQSTTRYAGAADAVFSSHDNLGLYTDLGDGNTAESIELILDSEALSVEDSVFDDWHSFQEVDSVKHEIHLVAKRRMNYGD